MNNINKTEVVELNETEIEIISGAGFWKDVGGWVHAIAVSSSDATRGEGWDSLYTL